MELLIDLVVFTGIVTTVHIYLRKLQISALAIFGLLYPIGKDLQVYLSWPRLIRWYMADVGFVAFSGLFMFLFFTVMSKKHLSAKTLNFCLVCAWFGATTAEVFSIFHPWGHQIGDWLDIVAFTAGLIVSVLIIKGIDFRNQSNQLGS